MNDQIVMEEENEKKDNCQTEQEKNRFDSIQYDLNTKFERSNWYRNLQRKRDKELP